MRRIISLAMLALAAACTPRPAVQPTPAQPVRPAQQYPQSRGDLIGMTASELAQRFGRPAFQVREGPGIKLQFRGTCVLDAYLYPPADGRGPERVTHIDTRLASGIDTDQAGCIRALAGA